MLAAVDLRLLPGAAGPAGPLPRRGRLVVLAHRGVTVGLLDVDALLALTDRLPRAG